VSADRFISTQFCDDIRHEVGNKWSLIGCYGSTIQVAPMPSVLPKLCAMVKVCTPIDRPLEKLAVRLVREDKPLAEITFPPEGLTASPVGAQPDAKWRISLAMFVMSPFPVDTPFRVSVEAETEEGVLNGGGIWILAPPTADGEA
jgi:hypothetical protein